MGRFVIPVAHASHNNNPLRNSCVEYLKEGLAYADRVSNFGGTVSLSTCCEGAKPIRYAFNGGACDRSSIAIFVPLLSS
jgi:hypothetical protein